MKSIIRTKCSIIITVVMSIFLTLPAHSISLSQNVSYLGRWQLYFNSVQGQGGCQYTNTGTGGYAYAANGTCAPDFYVFNLNGKAWNKDYIVEIPLYVYDLKNDSLLSSYQNSSPQLQVNAPTGNFTAEYIGSYFNLDSTSSVVVSMYFRLNNGRSGTQYFNTSSSMSFYPRVGMNQGEYMSLGGDWGIVAFADMGNFSSTEIVNAINQARTENNAWQSQINQNIQEVRQAIIDNKSSVQNIDNSVQNIDNMYQTEQDNLNNQQTDIDSDSSSSQQSAESTGTTLLGAFTAFVGALTSASPSNCNLDMDLGNLDLGIVNLCSLSPPPIFQTISSIFLILFVVPLSIATARKVISLFRSFQ